MRSNAAGIVVSIFILSFLNKNCLYDTNKLSRKFLSKYILFGVYVLLIIYVIFIPVRNCIKAENNTLI